MRPHHREIISAYRRGGVSYAALAERYGITSSAVHYILKRNGALPTASQVNAKRCRASFWADPQRSADARRRLAESARRRRPALVWPDCPPELREDYETLRRVYPARMAKAKLLEAAR